jgi:DNA helicase-2/ATP-dependent DNA helicase PcrA
VLFLSFSNAAVFRLADAARINLVPNERRCISFRTYHSLAADVLRSYGRFVGLPPVFRIMDSLEEMLVRVEEGVPSTGADHIEFLRQRAAQGYLGFAVLVPLAERVLVSSERLRRIYGRTYPLIVVDEFQDTSPQQWQLLQSVGAYTEVIAFGDPNQIIYAGMHAATEARLREFQEWKKATPMAFSERQFRFGSPEVLVFAEAMLNGTPYTEKKDSGVYLLDLQFRTKHNDRLRTALALIWRELREKGSRDDSIAFFAFSNKVAEQLAVALRNPPEAAKVSFPVYARLTRDEAAYDAVLLAMVALRDLSLAPSEMTSKRAAVALMAMNASWNNRVTVTTARVRRLADLLSESVRSGSELGQMIASLVDAPHIDGCVAAFLKVMVQMDGFKASCNRIAAHGRLHLPALPAQEATLPLFEQMRSLRVPKGLDGYDAGEGRTHVLNYHRTKGREFDHVVMLVDPRAESSRISIAELRRLYYVCGTRARSSLWVLYYGQDKGRVLNSVV